MPHTDAQKQLIQIPFGKGADEGNGAFVGELGKPVVLENGRITRNGSVEVRRGFEQLLNTVVAAGANLQPVDCFSHDEQLLALEYRNICEYSESLGKWIRSDYAPEAQIEDVDIGFRGIAYVGLTQYPACDAVKVGNYRVIAWHSESGLGGYTHTRVIDTASGAKMDFDAWLTIDQAVRLLVIGTKIYCCYRSANAVVSARILDCTSAATVQTGWSAATSLCTDLSAAHPQWECNSVWASTAYLVMAYTRDILQEVGLVPRGTLRRWDSTLAFNFDRSLTTYAATAYAVNAWGGTVDRCIEAHDEGAAGSGIVASAQSLVAWGNLFDSAVIDNGVSIPIYTATTRMERIGIAMYGNGNCRVVYSHRAVYNAGNYYDPVVVHVEVDLETGNANATGSLYNFTLGGQPISLGTGTWIYAPVQVARKPWHLYTWSVDESKRVRTEKLPLLQSSLFLVELPLLQSSGSIVGLPTNGHSADTNRAVIRLCPYLSAPYDGINGGAIMRPPNTFTSDGFTFLLAVPKLSDGSIDIDVGFDTYKFSFDPNIAVRRPCRIGPVTLLSGGVPTQWDGDILSEVGWNYYPRIGTIVPSNAAGNLLPTGIYSYRAVYTWVDAAGQRHTSTPSVAQSVTMGAADKTVTITADSLTLTDRNDPGSQCPVVVEFYRTLMITPAGGGPAVAGTEYYYVGRVANDPAVGSVVLIDTLRDQDLTAAVPAVEAAERNKMIPTSGGVIMGGCPGAVRQITTHDGRPWAILAEDPTQIAFGHSTLPGESPRFPDGWTLRCPRGRAYTALGTAGDKLIAFQDHSIDAIFGSGPGDTGSGSNYNDPQLVCENVGCTDPRSLVHYSGGYLFMSSGGLWSVTEGLSASYAGLQIADTVATYPIAKSMILDDSEGRVVVMLSNTAGTLGTLAAWYYNWNLWSTWPVLDVLGGHLPPLGGCVWDRAGVRRIVFVGVSEYIYCERTTSLYKDPDATWITLRLQYGWMSLAGLQGWAHGWQIAMLGYYKQPTSVVAAICYDYDTSYTETHTWSNADIAALLHGNRVQIAIQPVRGEAQSMRLTLAITTSGSTAGNTGALIRLEALTIETAQEAGIATLAAEARK